MRYICHYVRFTLRLDHLISLGHPHLKFPYERSVHCSNYYHQIKPRVLLN